jgi:hypothetical protein
MTAKAQSKPLLPPEAEAEIMERLSANMKISSGEIAGILEKHGVSGDVDALQNAYRKRVGQRLMSSFRDENGKREVLAAQGGEYIVVECCSDQQKLKTIRRRIQGQMNGLDDSAGKVRCRIRVLSRVSSVLNGKPAKRGDAE